MAKWQKTSWLSLDFHNNPLKLHPVPQFSQSENTWRPKIHRGCLLFWEFIANTNLQIQRSTLFPHSLHRTQSVSLSVLARFMIERFTKAKLASGRMENPWDKEFIAHTDNTHACMESDSWSNAGSNSIWHFVFFCRCWQNQNWSTAQPDQKNSGKHP